VEFIKFDKTMISYNDLNRCIDILSELNAHIDSNEVDKSLILELGYIIKQELDLVKSWDDANNKNAMKRGIKQIDPQKLLEDNIQLFNEKEKLLKILAKMKEDLEKKVPLIQKELSLIKEKFDILNNHIEKKLC
jgi:hypothetical protein